MNLSVLPLGVSGHGREEEGVLGGGAFEDGEFGLRELVCRIGEALRPHARCELCFAEHLQFFLHLQPDPDGLGQRVFEGSSFPRGQRISLLTALVGQGDLESLGHMAWGFAGFMEKWININNGGHLAAPFPSCLAVLSLKPTSAH